MVGRVIKKEANSFLVDIGAENIICTSQKKLKTNGVYVGDRVEVDEKAKQILKTLPRTNKLLRPPLVNLDKLFIFCFFFKILTVILRNHSIFELYFQIPVFQTM